MYKQQGNKGIFDEEFTIEKLSKIANPLKKINEVIDFKMFRNLLESELLNRLSFKTFL